MQTMSKANRLKPFFRIYVSIQHKTKNRHKRSFIFFIAGHAEESDHHLRCMFINHNEIMNRLMSLTGHISIPHLILIALFGTWHCNVNEKIRRINGHSKAAHEYSITSSIFSRCVHWWKLFSFMNRVIDIFFFLLSDMINNDNKPIFLSLFVAAGYSL
jgi:hypothetical protein